MSLYYTLAHGEKDIASAGTNGALFSTETPVRMITIQAKTGNSNNVYIGTSTVSDSSFGVYLTAGQTYTIRGELPDCRINAADIYIDVDTNGEGVTFMYY